jgi:HEAT repeat protein
MVLRRWLGTADTQQGGVEAALKGIALLPREQQRDWIVRAAHDPRYAELALTLIGNMRDPSYLPVLEEFLAPGFQMQGVNAPTAALDALTRYFEDRAADIILKVAGSTPDPGLRDAAFKSLATIRRYQEEKGRWKTQQTSSEAWAQSVHALVALLDDAEPAVRAQAVRGLATLGAKQEMPRVVGMLKDKDESVRKAAEEALGVLNSPPKKD